MRNTALLLLMISAFAATTAAQKKTFILVRHAEKDVSANADKVDPELADEGKARAARLVKVLKKYRPGAVYSSNFKRTRDTAQPVALWRKKGVEIYDHKDLKAQVDRMMVSKTKRFLVVGHNSTTPALANLLIKEDKYKTLPESDYGKIWIVKMKKGKVKSVEVLDY